ncbi:hypothetical protein LguiB_026997 [Lonicera macranthoides]
MTPSCSHVHFLHQNHFVVCLKRTHLAKSHVSKSQFNNFILVINDGIRCGKKWSS